MHEGNLNRAGDDAEGDGGASLKKWIIIFAVVEALVVLGVVLYSIFR